MMRQRTRQRLRRLGFGLSTLLGRPRGFFAPYRYAAAVAPPAGYPALARVFEAAFARSHGEAMLCPADVLAGFSRYAEALVAIGGDAPAPAPRWNQAWYPRLDAAAAYVIVRAAAPGRIVEVGSGHSTRFIARALQDAEADGGPPAAGRITCIDPAPRAALTGLPVSWERRLLAPGDCALFESLASGDIAFFDSSHLLWPGSDVDLILNTLLPVLRPGVLVHLHDVFLPDPYPEAWAWRGYTEQLGLGGWLAGGAFEIVWASHFARTRAEAARHPTIAGLPLPDAAPESALWLRRR